VSRELKKHIDWSYIFYPISYPGSKKRFAEATWKVIIEATKLEPGQIRLLDPMCGSGAILHFGRNIDAALLMGGDINRYAILATQAMMLSRPPLSEDEFKSWIEQSKDRKQYKKYIDSFRFTSDECARDANKLIDAAFSIKSPTTRKYLLNLLVQNTCWGTLVWGRARPKDPRKKQIPLQEHQRGFLKRLPRTKKMIDKYLFPSKSKILVRRGFARSLIAKLAERANVLYLDPPYWGHRAHFEPGLVKFLEPQMHYYYHRFEKVSKEDWCRWVVQLLSNKIPWVFFAYTRWKRVLRAEFWEALAKQSGRKLVEIVTIHKGLLGGQFGKSERREILVIMKKR